MAGFRRRGVLAAGAALLAVAGSGVAEAGPAATTGWRVADVVKTPSMTTVLYGVTSAGPGHAWAVGGANPASTGGGVSPTAVAQAWDGSAWQPVSLPAWVQYKLRSYSPFDTAAAVIVSGQPRLWVFTNTGQWLRYDGTTWSAGQITSNSRLNLTVLASLNLGGGGVWAFGGTGAGPVLTPYAARLGKLGWVRTTVPGKGVIVGASAVSGADIWAVLGIGLGDTGSTSRSGELVHWSAGRWHQVASLPAGLRTNELGSVLARSDHDVWIGSALPNSKGGTTEAIGHWNGRRWTVTRLTAPAVTGHYHVISIVPDGTGGLWALGYCEPRACPTQASRFWHHTNGRWTGPYQPKLASKATPIYALAAAGHAVWAAGTIGPNGPDGLIALWGPTPR